MSPDCIFCKIANKEIPSNFIYEDENVVAFNDLNPQAPVHFLVIPKNHYSSLNDINDKKVFGDIFSAIPKITEKLGIKEYRTVVNTGASAGQTVFHIHVHVMSGREFTWPAG
ncbi:TPA: histidine triad nucleotide-binding protein [Candidatus Avigastranaerophilus faecigallinarum]|nr:histidine triad nucleotide-binding protein [Candidatus Avigastranaerophilus faecigallinarum]